MSNEHKPIEEQTIVEKLRIRAQIRRKIGRRPEGQADRIADLCEEAAAEIERLQNLVNELQKSQPESETTHASKRNKP